MKRFLNKFNSKKLSVIARIALALGIVFVALSVWGFIKSSHVSMTSKNGSSVTLVWVGMRWINMLLGILGLGGGFWLLKKSDSASEKDDASEKTEEDPFDFLK